MFHLGNTPVNLQRISDLGGQQVLGMGGSLRGYIETGNQYDSAYFKGQRKNKKQPCEKDNSVVKKVITAGLAIGAAALGIFAIYKNGGVKASFGKLKGLFTDAGTKIKDIFKKEPAAEGEKVQGIFSKAKDFVTQKASKIGDFFKKPPVAEGGAEAKSKFGEFISGLGDKVKNFFKTKK